MRANASSRVHLIGIGGSGLASLASYLLERGDEVSGCERALGPTTDLLSQCGARIASEHHEDHVDPTLECVVHSAAVSNDHPELLAARKHGVRCEKYASFLGQQMRGKMGLAVAGSHGKTSTSGLLAHILVAGGKDPSAIIGGHPVDWALPGRWGAGEAFVVEACEYDRSFLKLPPRCAIITNIEADHLDYFGDESAVYQAFQEFAEKLPANGLLVLHESASRVLDLQRVRAEVSVVGENAGLSDALEDVKVQHGSWRGRLRVDGLASVELAPSKPGRHSLVNAALAASLALRLGVDAKTIARAVRGFGGMRRRLEPLGLRRGVEWISDYAHHPTEVGAVRDAMRDRYPGRRLLAVFQPHQVARTRTFRESFAEQLAGFDEVLLPGIYAAREAPQEASGELGALVESVARLGGRPTRLEGLDCVMGTVDRLAKRGDLVLLMGAGDIGQLATTVTSGDAEDVSCSI